MSSEEERALKKKRQAEERRKQRKIEQLESRIAELEEEIEEIQKKMCDPAILSNSKKLTELDRKQNEAQTELDQLVSRGEYLAARLMAELLEFQFVDAAEWRRFIRHG